MRKWRASHMLKYIITLVMCFTIAQSFAATGNLSSKFRTAVFWNDGTSIVPDETPAGYRRPAKFTDPDNGKTSDYVGEFTAGLTDTSLTKAPEIGRSALKLFLTALDHQVNYDTLTTLDTAKIKAYVEDNSGVIAGANPPVLPNVRIYSIYDDVTLSEIQDDFGGEMPEVITVINSGGDLKQSDLDKMNIDEMLFEACQEEVGVFLLGSASTSFAVAIDKICDQKNIPPYFAVKGIQKAFNVQSYKGSLLFDFDLTGDDDVQDTVVLQYDGTNHKIRKASSVKFNASTDHYDYIVGDVIYDYEGTTKITDKLNSGIKVTTHWGQFVIEGATAQSVISYDSYGPDMNSGVNYASSVLSVNADDSLIVTSEILADLIPNYSGNSIPVNGVIKEAGEGKGVEPKLFRAFISVESASGAMGKSLPYTAGHVKIIGAEAYDDGKAWISGVENDAIYIFAPAKAGAGSDAVDYTQFVKTDGTKYTAETSGDHTNAIKLKKGDKVEVWSQKDNKNWEKDVKLGYFEVDDIIESYEKYTFTFTDDFVVNNSRIFYAGDVLEYELGYELVYPQSGYSDLTIDMMDIAGNGNSEIFKKIFQISALGEDEKIPFKKWEDNGRIQCAAEIWAVNEKVDIAKFSDWYGPGGSFDPSKYYFGRFAQQFAKGDDEFYSLKENAAKDGFDRSYFDALPDDGQDAFKDKEYYTLSVIQHGHQRVAIAGYQPQYIDAVQKSIDIITDLFNWTAVDDSRMPPGFPTILKGSTVYESGDTIPTNVEKLAVVIDFTKKDEDVYDNGAGYDFSCNIQYAEGNSTPIKLTMSELLSKSKVSGENIDTLFFDISTLIDPSEVSKTTLKIDSCIVWPAGGNVGMVEESKPKSARYDIRKLIAEFVGGTDFLVKGEVQVKSEQYTVGNGTKTFDLASDDKPTIVISGDKLSEVSGESTFKVEITEGQNIKAYAKYDGFVNSDEISREYTKGSITFPKPKNIVPLDSILFVTDSIGLEVELSGELEDLDAKYKIEWSIEYDGSVVKTGLGDENKEVKIAVKDFVLRDNTSATKFKIKGTTISQDLSNFNSSGDTTYEYTVKQLETDPESAATIEFKGKTSLQVTALYDDKDVESADIVYVLGTTEKSMKSGKHTDEFADSVKITFWAEDVAYINSDTVKGYQFDKVDVTLPKPKPTIQPDEVNGKDTYLFSTDTSIFLTLEQFIVNEVAVTSDAYDIDYTTNGVSASMEDTGAIDLPLSYIDKLIEDGASKLDIGAKCVSEDTDIWLHGESMSTKTYEFREVDVEVEDLTKDTDADKIEIKLTTKDPITGEELNSGELYYTVNGSTPDKSKSGPVSSGSTITVDNGIILKVIGYRSGYMPGTGQGIFTKDAMIIADPESGTFFGEKLDVTLTSNLSPIFYTIDGGDTLKFDDFTGTMTLDDALATLIRDDDTVKIHAWVEGNDYINGTQADFEYYRRKLAKVDIDPKSGDYKKSIDVTMTCSDGDYIFYELGDVVKPSTKYDETFKVDPEPIVTITAQAREEGWLDSDTSQVTYQRIASISDAAYYDANADGIIDSAVISFENVFPGLVKPDTVICELPNGDEVDTVVLADIDIDKVNNKIIVNIDAFTTILTGFSDGPHIQLIGNTFEKNVKTEVTDSVAPVINSARYAPGPQDQSGAREYDVLTVEFTEEVSELDIDAANPDQLFMYGGGARTFTGNVATESSDGATYTFHVTELTGVTYPSKGDSIWINIDAFTPVEDEVNNVQDNRNNRRVELTVEKLPISVEVRSFWMKDVIINKVAAFGGVVSPDEIPLVILDEDGQSGASFDVKLGGIIVVDPKIPFAEEDAKNFKAEIAILDAVGNEVISTSAVFEKSNGHLHAMPALMRFQEKGKTVERWVIAAAWDGRNSSGRTVHARTFKVMTLSEWPGIDGAIKADGVVPVFKLSEE